MQKIIRSLNFVPGAVFLLLALFLGARLAIGAFPDEPLAWQAYLKLASAWREIAVFIPPDSWPTGIALVSCATLGIWSLALAQRTDHRRSRFVLNHTAFVAIMFGMSDERVFSASVRGVSPTSTSIIPDFGHADPLMVALLAFTAVACLQTHRAIIWALRHPTRQVQ